MNNTNCNATQDPTMTPRRNYAYGSKTNTNSMGQVYGANTSSESNQASMVSAMASARHMTAASNDEPEANTNFNAQDPTMTRQNYAFASTTNNMDQDYESSASPQDNQAAKALERASNLRKAITSDKLEVKRITNRLSARRCRLRQKKLINDLQNTNSLLKSENANLRLKLELAMAENKRLEVIRVQEKKKQALKQTHALHLTMQRQARKQSNPRRMSTVLPPQAATTATALLELAGQPPPTPELVPASPPRALERRVEAHPTLANSNAPTFPELGASSRRSESDESSVASQRDVVAIEQEIQALHQKVSGLKDFLARHSI